MESETDLELEAMIRAFENKRKYKYFTWMWVVGVVLVSLNSLLVSTFTRIYFSDLYYVITIITWVGVFSTVLGSLVILFINLFSTETDKKTVVNIGVSLVTLLMLVLFFI